ncbi:hypothetical protein FOS14_14095 [Skermania sp. ID1734]|uniref:hypothetical protein n=1 Tax=Skermania sp. ID1734 TaxID=2597516 RepID=UPI0011801070|nr:hypothetical protein [Skermania sp. ID1734]TSD98115.1 hypothetical protein FOS14_14095 [Skermania sp. ID1734]
MTVPAQRPNAGPAAWVWDAGALNAGYRHIDQVLREVAAPAATGDPQDAYVVEVCLAGVGTDDVRIDMSGNEIRVALPDGVLTVRAPATGTVHPKRVEVRVT